MRVLVPSREDVAEGAEAGHSDDHLLVAQEGAQSRHNVALKEDNDSFITTLIGNVGESPADIVKNLGRVVLGKNFGEGGDRSLNFFETRGWLSFAEVGQGPDGVARE